MRNLVAEERVTKFWKHKNIWKSANKYVSRQRSCDLNSFYFAKEKKSLAILVLNCSNVTSQFLARIFTKISDSWYILISRVFEVKKQNKKLWREKNTRSISQEETEIVQRCRSRWIFIIHRFTTNTQAKIWVMEIPRWF